MPFIHSSFVCVIACRVRSIGRRCRCKCGCRGVGGGGSGGGDDSDVI